jgi:outer membrane protein insertion porin family
VTFSFFDDFCIDTALNKGQLKQSPEGFATLTSPLYGCPTLITAVTADGTTNTCAGGTPGDKVGPAGEGFQRDIRPISGTNFVPRMSTGAEISVIMPIINAPFRLYYAYNPLRLYERPYCNSVLTGNKVESCSAELITRDLFPQTDAGEYTYKQAIQAFGARNQFREPRKTFRLTVSTTF